MDTELAARRSSLTNTLVSGWIFLGAVALTLLGAWLLGTIIGANHDYGWYHLVWVVPFLVAWGATMQFARKTSQALNILATWYLPPYSRNDLIGQIVLLPVWAIAIPIFMLVAWIRLRSLDSKYSTEPSA